LNDKTHRTWIKIVMNAVGIVSSKSTYASRKTGAQQAEILGVPEAEVKLIGSLQPSTLTRHSDPKGRQMDRS
jgi:hypothetical protein